MSGGQTRATGTSAGGVRVNPAIAEAGTGLVRQGTDAAIDAAAERSAVEKTLSAKLAEAETRIAASKAKAMQDVHEVAAETAAAEDGGETALGNLRFSHGMVRSCDPPTRACLRPCIMNPARRVQTAYWRGRRAQGRAGLYRAALHEVRVELLHKLHDERRYESMEALCEGIAQDEAEARAWLAQRARSSR